LASTDSAPPLEYAPAYQHAFLLQDGVMTDLGTLGATP
jgi:uncharacterized membrane protein